MSPPPDAGGGAVAGINQQSFDNGTSYTYSYSGAGLGVDVGASVQGNVAWGSGEWGGPFTQVSISIGTFTGSIFWSSGKGGWMGTSWGIGGGAPAGLAVEKSNYTCQSGPGPG